LGITGYVLFLLPRGRETGDHRHRQFRESVLGAGVGGVVQLLDQSNLPFFWVGIGKLRFL
jgi:hypothetical protein